MKIALDWDDTFTRDPLLWERFIKTALNREHDVRVVTFRYLEHCDDISRELRDRGLPIQIMATEHELKRESCEKMGWVPDVWIDDRPELIV